MSRTNACRRLLSSSLFAALAWGTGLAGVAQHAHPHTPSVSGMPQGIPFFCADPAATTVANGRWSDPLTWSTHKVPGANDRIVIATSHEVTYDAVSDVTLDCIEVRGRLVFAASGNTLMKVATILVLDEGHLQIGSRAAPVADRASAQLVIADQPVNPAIDPGQLGTGLISLGKVTMHGALKTPTFVRLRRESLAGQTTLETEQPVVGWTPGDEIVIPDTRQLRSNERGSSYRSQTEKLQIASVVGREVTLTTALQYDHKGARNADGTLELLPHVGNVTRNVIVRSENPRGTRGHTMFISRADVDLRYVEFKELGRTKPGALDSTQFDADGRAVKVGMNQIGRYAVHFHHDFGPKTPPPNGYQFTLIGSSVDGAAKWGIAVHRSHYGLIQDNVVYNTRGAGIVTEDGSESFNVFDHNFAVLSAGRSPSPVGAGYGSQTLDVGGEGAGFWFRGPNNYIRNNVSANGDKTGFALSAAALGTIRIPAVKGSDTSRAAESVQADTTNASVLEFANNEAYGTIQNGLSCVWNGAIASLTVWHASDHGFTGIPPENLVLDKLTVRGDVSALRVASETPVGVLIANYIAKSVTVSNADVQGMRVGVLSPFFYNQTLEANRAPGSLVVDNGYFRNHVGVSLATAYSVGRGEPVKSAVVRRSVFDSIDVKGLGIGPSEPISMNYGMTRRDSQPRDPILVYDYNKKQGDNFKMYYSLDAPDAAAPCQNAAREIGGWVCR